MDKFEIEDDDIVQQWSEKAAAFLQVIIFGLGVYNIFNNWGIISKNVYFQYFTFIVLGSEIFLFLCSCFSIGCLRIIFGRKSPQHSYAIFGLLYQTLIYGSFFGSFGLGCWLFYSGVMSSNSDPLALLLFVGLELIASGINCVFSLSTIGCMILYFAHKVDKAIKKKPEIEFFNPNKPVSFVQREIELPLKNIDKKEGFFKSKYNKWTEKISEEGALLVDKQIV